MFMEIYIYIYIYKFICFHLFYKCLNKKGNVVFLTLIMLKKYEMIMVFIVL